MQRFAKGYRSKKVEVVCLPREIATTKRVNESDACVVAGAMVIFSEKRMRSRRCKRRTK
jgi:hypothetical protein